MLEFIKTRDNDFIAKCRKICDGLHPGERISCHELAHRAISGGAPEYYVTFDYAYRMLRTLRHNRLPPNYNPLKRLMWAEIAEKADHYKCQMGIKTDTEALSIVLARSCASRFFITTNYAIRLLQQLNHDHKIKHNTPLLLVPYRMGMQHKPSQHARCSMLQCG